MGFFDSLGDMVGSTFEFVGETVSSVASGVGKVAETVYDGASYVASGTVKVVSDVTTTVAEEALNVVEKAVDYAIENPGKTALMVAGTVMGAPVLARVITSGGTLSAAAKSLATMAAVEAGKNAPSLTTVIMSAGAIATKPIPTGAHAISAMIASAKITAVYKKHLGDSVRLKPGAIVHCNLFVAVEHTGIYIGNGQIVELTGEGEIRITDFNGFTEGTGAENVYAACNNDKLLYSESIKNRALSHVNSSRNYNLLINNCHKFTAQCVSGNQCNTTTLFSLLELEIMKHFGVFGLEWRRAVASDKSIQTSTSYSETTHKQPVKEKAREDDLLINHGLGYTKIVIDDYVIDVSDLQNALNQLGERYSYHSGLLLEKFNQRDQQACKHHEAICRHIVDKMSEVEIAINEVASSQEEFAYVFIINGREIEVKDVEKTLEVLARMRHGRYNRYLEENKQGYFESANQTWEEYLALNKAFDDLKELTGAR